MCIRDRLTLLQKSLSDTLSTQLSSLSEANVRRMSEIRETPVSYTHLDVYKRQVEALAI